MSCSSALFFGLAFAASLAIVNGQSLPSVASVDPNSITVSGISSGGVFASQFHVAYSTVVKGVGMWASPPNLCYFLQALLCLTMPSFVSADVLVAETRVLEGLGSIDATSHLANDKVFIHHGTEDATVNPGFATIVKEYYNSFLASDSQIMMKIDLPATHALVSDRHGTNCGTTNSQLFIEDCDYDSVQAMFEHLYGPGLNDPTPDGQLTGKLQEFSQDEFFSGFASMAEEGYVYIPEACASGTSSCHLHVHFHGCAISSTEVGTDYMTMSGLLESADANNIVLLLPQIKSTILGNPSGCWNWFGYLGDYFGATYATKSATQMKGIYRMIERVIGQ